MEKKIDFYKVTLDWQKVEYNSTPSKIGVYQIYGTSPIYGVDTLLYIGQTKRFDRRHKEHFDNTLGFIGRQPNLTCRFAELPNITVGKMSRALLLTAVEEVLIIMHKPSFNSQRLINISKPIKEITNEHLLYIQNHGERGMLNLEVTNYYFKEFS